MRSGEQIEENFVDLAFGLGEIGGMKPKEIQT